MTGYHLHLHFSRSQALPIILILWPFMSLTKIVSRSLRGSVLGKDDDHLCFKVNKGWLACEVRSKLESIRLDSLTVTILTKVVSLFVCVIWSHLERSYVKSWPDSLIQVRSQGKFTEL